MTATTPDRPASDGSTDHPDHLDDGGPPPAGSPLPASRSGRLVFALAGLALVASFGVWAYAYSGAADRPAPDLLSDPSFAAEAESICEVALADIEALPNALDAEDGAERADQVRAATARFATMVDELDALVGGDARDVEIQSGWLADWRVLLDDRERYADAIAEDPEAQFYLTDTGVGERLDRRVTRMADTNEMFSCGAPEDVG